VARAEHRLEAARQLLDDVARGAALDRRRDSVELLDALNVADADALAREQLEADEVLEARGEPLPPRRRVDRREVDAVDRDPPRRRDVEPASA